MKKISSLAIRLSGFGKITRSNTKHPVSFVVIWRIIHIFVNKLGKHMAAKKDRVLWADDEIDLLKPHILFLQDKGYEVVPVVSGQDAIDCCKEQSFDIIFLDENIPGLTGL